MNNEERFFRIVKDRSIENLKSFDLLYKNKYYGNCLSLIRQELDSYIRVIFYKNIDNPDVKKDLLINFFDNGVWKNTNRRRYTDFEMISKEIYDPWCKNVYDFGCAFIHLSNSWEYNTSDILGNINIKERDKINNFINNYHGAFLDETSTFDDYILYLPKIIKKISNNLIYHIEN